MGRRFRIKTTPIGTFPEWVRDAFVGLKLPSVPCSRDVVFKWMGVVEGEEPKELSFFVVNGKEAIELMKQKNPRASAWLLEMAYYLTRMRLVFPEELCEWID